jgi:hypothetical protein
VATGSNNVLEPSDDKAKDKKDLKDAEDTVTGNTEAEQAPGEGAQEAATGVQPEKGSKKNTKEGIKMAEQSSKSRTGSEGQRRERAARRKAKEPKEKDEKKGKEKEDKTNTGTGKSRS